jgi:hypothetical protein
MAACNLFEHFAFNLVILKLENFRQYFIDGFTHTCLGQLSKHVQISITYDSSQNLVIELGLQGLSCNNFQ